LNISKCISAIDPPMRLYLYRLRGNSIFINYCLKIVNHMKTYNIRLLLRIIFLLTLMNSMIYAQSNELDQNGSIQTREEIDELADRFIASLFTTGSMRKVDPKLLHPLFFNPPCIPVPAIGNEICNDINAVDRREYTIAISNSIWLMSQIALLRPLLNRDYRNNNQRESARDLLLSTMPIELRNLFKNIDKQIPIKSIDEFRELYNDVEKMENILTADYQKASNGGKQTTKWFYDSLEKEEPKKEEQGIKQKLRHFNIEQLPEAFVYEKKMFRFIVAKDDSVFKVIHFSLAISE
jgi:hypothetical protein